MNWVLLTTVIGAALVAVGIFAYRSWNPRREEFRSFRHWVKNPEYKKAVADYFAARDSLQVPEDISDDEIRRMVDRLFVAKDEDFNSERLELIGGKAVPFLIEALERPETAERRFEGHFLLPRSPFERICKLLAPIGPPDAVRPLAKYVEHDDEHFRKHAAMALGNIGIPECVEPVRKALADGDDHVRSFAVMGIQRGINAARCTDEFLDAVFPALVGLLKRQMNTKKVAPVLLAIDPDRALPILLSPEHLSVENRGSHHIIRALNKAGHKIPHERLLQFLEEVRPHADRFPYDRAYSEALKAYAFNPDGAAEQTFRAELDSRSEKVREAAAEALGFLSGIEDPYTCVLEAEKTAGFDALSEPQKYYFAAAIYNYEVNNGGHAQYFVNSDGDHWKWALEGLKAMGAEERARILDEATSLFGPPGPSEESDARHRQIARFSRQQDERLDELDSRYYSCPESIKALLALYALDHKEHFAG